MHHFVYSIISDLKSQRVLILGGTTSCFQVKLGVAYVGKLHINDEVFNVMQGRIPDASSFLLPNPNCCCYKATRLGNFLSLSIRGGMAWNFQTLTLTPKNHLFSRNIVYMFSPKFVPCHEFFKFNFYDGLLQTFSPIQFFKVRAHPSLFNDHLKFVKSAWCLSNS